MKTKVLITGGSGMVGSHLSHKLANQGFEVVHLSRTKSKSQHFKTYLWDIPGGTIEAGAFDGVQYIIHLAGAGVADKRWTASRKSELYSSRIKSAELIFSVLQKQKHSVQGFISASAIGIYGFDTGGIVQTEERDQLGDDYLATLTKSWEQAADEFKKLDMRVVKLRIGLVLSERGGLLDKLLPLAKMGLSSAFGSGDQYMSWIHIDDITDLITYAIKNKGIKGVFNAVAPNPVNNKEFLKQLAVELNRPYFLPNTPKFLLRLAFGELASAITGGNLVSSKKAESAGYKFKYPHLNEALKDLLKK